MTRSEKYSVMSNKPKLSRADPSCDSFDASDAAEERTVLDSATS